MNRDPWAGGLSHVRCLYIGCILGGRISPGGGIGLWKGKMRQTQLNENIAYTVALHTFRRSSEL